MTSLIRTARFTGAAYLALAVFGLTGFLVIRRRLSVEGDSAATLANLVEHSSLAHLGIALELLVVIAQAAAAVGFYALFRRDRPVAAYGVATFGMANAITILVSAALLVVASGVAAIQRPHRRAMRRPRRPPVRRRGCLVGDRRDLLRSLAHPDGLVRDLDTADAASARLGARRRRRRLCVERPAWCSRPDGVAGSCRHADGASNSRRILDAHLPARRRYPARDRSAKPDPTGSDGNTGRSLGDPGLGRTARQRLS